MSQPTEQLKELLHRNFLLHLIIENEVKLLKYGTITINVELKNGQADITTINIVANKRIKYSPWQVLIGIV